MLGWARRPNLRTAHVPRLVLPQGAKTRVRVFADIKNFALRGHCVGTACTAFPSWGSHRSCFLGGFSSATLSPCASPCSEMFIFLSLLQSHAPSFWPSTPLFSGLRSGPSSCLSHGRHSGTRVAPQAIANTYLPTFVLAPHCVPKVPFVQTTENWNWSRGRGFKGYLNAYPTSHMHKSIGVKRLVSGRTPSDSLDRHSHQPGLGRLGAVSCRLSFALNLHHTAIHEPQNTVSFPFGPVQTVGTTPLRSQGWVRVPYTYIPGGFGATITLGQIQPPFVTDWAHRAESHVWKPRGRPTRRSLQVCSIAHAVKFTENSAF